MAETVNTPIAGENVQTVSGTQTPTTGTAGAQTQMPGRSTTVSESARATGGIDAGNFIATAVDKNLFEFHKDDTPLMQLMLRAKTVNVDSPEVQHYMIDEPRSEVVTSAKLEATTARSAVLPLEVEDQSIPAEYGTLLVKGVDGYTEDGQTRTPGKDLMIAVTGTDPVTNNPVIIAVNGPKTNRTDEYCTVPEIPAGTTCIILSNALYETQKEVDPDTIVPKPILLYLQKRGMNQIVSDYFDAQKKQIPFSKALIAEQAITNFKVKGNRTLWSGRKGKVTTKTKIGPQTIYYTEGVRWQFKRLLQKTGKWTYEQFIALAKMFYTGEDVPKTALLLAGKNLLENIQCIDFSKHPEVTITVTTNSLGWEVTRIHTVFGDIDIKREPTLDYLKWSNSGALIGEDRLVHYVYRNEHSFDDDVEGEEAKRSGVLVWDGLGLKGTCHIWIDGEGTPATLGATGFTMWDSEAAPTGDDLIDGQVYYLLCDCPGISKNAMSGQMWKYTKATTSWDEFNGDLFAQEE